MTILYNLRSYPTGDQTEFVINKFDDDMNVESTYRVNATNCECPQGHKPVCRHRRMLPAMIPIADTEEFYCYDNHLYYGMEGQGYRKPKATPKASSATTCDLGSAGATARGSERAQAKPEPSVIARDGILGSPGITEEQHAKDFAAVTSPPSRLLLDPVPEPQAEPIERIRRRI